MTTAFNKPGDALDHVAAADIAVNSVVPVGSFIGVAATNIPKDATGTLFTDGVFTLPKVAGTAFPEGSLLTWSVSGGGFILGAGEAGDVANCAKVVEQSAAAADTSVRVYIHPALGTAVAA